ncbi:MAG: phage head morphogenesis protein [Cyanomargarita calcarea GSE-NOS-MK-12-04C]|uniref:Phage head morphogenesis protein n=1 Tax=Cyanomargarita calcarea GSE-NOS-MK-12-04C TaxID=2839659 RepID=A0A951QHE2_9CYAN|nr:phage head morphogenesis protein [Cyanomargarita calcarea GSE-NOS-MK-12-04C]
MPTAGEAFRIAQRFDKSLATAEDNTIARINQILLNSYLKLERTMRLKWDEMERDRPFLPAQRQLLVTEQLGYLLQLINPQQQSAIEAMFGELLAFASNHGVNLADALLGDAAMFSAVPVEAIAYSATESYNRLLRHGDDFASKASIAIGEGLAQGWGAQKIAGILKEQLGVTRWRAEAIARTESIKAYSNASQQKYNDAGVEEVVWVAVREGVCKFCTWRNGKAFKLGSIIHPGHVNCRCCLICRVGDIADNDFWLNYSDQLTGDPGLMPFEKAAGMAIPPKPTWIPKRKDG